jgi:hypothetical protein
MFGDAFGGVGAFRVTRFLTATVFGLALCVITGMSPGSACADVPAYEGVMTFPAIQDPSGPEDFSWKVILAENQALEQLDDQTAIVYYVPSHQTAFTISAEAAHDAIGTNVPTILEVTGEDIITLVVRHRAGNPNAGGAPFAYPVVAGQGWEGGFQPVIVQGPPDEAELAAQREREASEAPRAHSEQATAANKCRVGSKAPSRVRRSIARLQKLSVPATVIGCGRSPAGALELIGYETKARAFCFGVLLLRLGSMQGGECKLDTKSWESTCPHLCVTAAFGGGWTHKRGFRFTVVSGVSPPELSGIEVLGGRGSRRLETPAVLGRLTGTLMEKFKQSEPIALFGAVLPACVSVESVSALARGEAGQVASSGRHFPDLLSHPCHPPPPPQMG